MRGVIHALYWRLHATFLRNERHDAEKFMAMLMDETKGRDHALEAEIGEPHMRRFLRIRERMETGEFGRIYGSGACAPLFGPLYPEADIPEKEFQKSLIKAEGRALLYRALGIRDWAGMLHELDLNPYGRCDFQIREGRIWHVVEVKMGAAPDSVVSQIDKYRVATELDMCLGTHDEVMAAVMAESFPPYVAAELSRLSVQMLTHRGTPESIARIERN